MKKWVSKADNAKQAKPFEREELGVLYERQMEAHTAHFAPFAVLATHGLQRGCETKLLGLEDIKELRAKDGTLNYLVDFSRQKRTARSTGNRGNSFVF